MNRKIKNAGIALASLSLAGGALVATTVPAQAAAKNYHIKADTGSSDTLDIFTGTNCTGKSHRLKSGESAQSTGWRSFWTTHGDTSNVSVYNGTTGKLIVQRFYEGECVRAYAGNDYLVWSYAS